MAARGAQASYTTPTQQVVDTGPSRTLAVRNVAASTFIYTTPTGQVGDMWTYSPQISETWGAQTALVYGPW